MTYQEFKNKYNEHYVDYDGYYGAQCWDLGQKYFTECLGLPAGVLGGCGLVNNMLKPPKLNELLQHFDEISVNNMIAGDVVIWSYGHIAIFDNWDGVKCNYFSQNPNPARVMPIYAGGHRAFRKKGTTPVAPPTNNTTKYTVVGGDTLSAIAKKYNTTVDALAQLNNIKDVNLIYVGQVLSIPGSKTGTEYVVRPGDTLSAIALRYGTTYQKIAADNNIANPNFIQIGQKLVIK